MDISELYRLAERERERRKPFRIRCCMAAGCQSSGARTVKDTIEDAISKSGLADRVEVCGVGCLRFCGHGPMVATDPDGELYEQVSVETAASMPKDLIAGTEIPQCCDRDRPFFARQLSIVLEHSGFIDPERIEDYIAVGGYESLYKVLYDMTAEGVVAEITQSGLRGRGGAGYPTGLKWATVAKMPGDQKYVICNGDEGDPGAFMDRSVLESDPHRVLEGMAIAGYAVGANHGFIYIRAEYPLAIQRLERAIKQAKRYGLLGSQIFESGFDFKIDIRIGAGAFVCGEETALIHSIEGGRGNPRARPPYPAELGLRGCPTLINNVETYANVVPIVRNGAAWFSSIGTETSKGTKVFALTGKVQNTGLLEVPMGTTLHQIVMEMGEGAVDGHVKAVQTGGPSGGCVPAERFDTPVDYESLQQLGTIMGSGGTIVIDDATSMVELAQFYMDFCRNESCGKCVPCRAGTVQLHEILKKITDYGATADDLEQLESLCHMVKEMSLCGLGQSAPNPVLSTLRYFRDEYLERLQPVSEQEGSDRVC
ncbi:MAG: NADH-ubiquinone oxidoreductase-F iron-sulfur binding region domain-containing protein [Synechococcus sp.]